MGAWLASLFLCALLAGPPARASEALLSSLRLHDPARDRPVSLKIWHPGEGGVGLRHYDYAFRAGARRHGEPLDGPPRPLILLSHGDRGSNVDQSWLAEALAARGYIVVAISHWQNTWKENTPAATLQVWERPRDLSFVIDALLADPAWGPRIDPRRIGVAGHSAGGYTALALAGAIYRPARMRDYCAAQTDAADCALGAGADLSTIDFRPARQSYRDPRVRAVVALAPALGPGIEADSLAAIDTPALIIAARDDEILRIDHHAAAYAGGIPGARLLELEMGGHFAFMPECTVMGRLFTWFHRFDICGRRSGADEVRAALHARVAHAVREFFHRHLRAPEPPAEVPS